MKKTIQHLKSLWKAETPKIARLLQVVSAALAALPFYYDSLSVDFQQSVPQNYKMTIALIGAVCAVGLQLTTTKK